MPSPVASGRAGSRQRAPCRGGTGGTGRPPPPRARVRATRVTQRRSVATPVNVPPTTRPSSTVKLWKLPGVRHSPDAGTAPSSPTVPSSRVESSNRFIRSLPPDTVAEVRPAVLRALDPEEHARLGTHARALSVPDAADQVAAALLRRLGRV